MSEEIQIEKTAEFWVQVDDVVCECGENLSFELTADGHNDLTITAERHDCLTENVERIESEIEDLKKEIEDLNSRL